MAARGRAGYALLAATLLVAVTASAELTSYNKTASSPGPTSPAPTDACAARLTPEACQASTNSSLVCSWAGECAYDVSQAQCFTASTPYSCSALPGCGWVRGAPGPANSTGEPWWEDPNHHGHGPFDLITPPVAQRLLAMNASTSVCDGAASVVIGFQEGNPGMANCTAWGFCNQSSALQAVYNLVTNSTNSTQPCDLCPKALSEGTIFLNKLPALGRLLRTPNITHASFKGACVPAVDSFLQLALYPDALQPLDVAGLACSTLRSALKLVPGLFASNTTTLCHDITVVLGVDDGVCSMLASLNITNPDQAVSMCNTIIPSLFKDDKPEASPLPSSPPPPSSSPAPWWEDPNHHGHGPFDLITPPVAQRLLDAQADAFLCNSLGAVLARPITLDATDTCSKAGLCPQPTSELQALLAGLGVNQPLCPICTDMLSKASEYVRALDAKLLSATGALALSNLLSSMAIPEQDFVGGVCQPLLHQLLVAALNPNAISQPAPLIGGACSAVKHLLELVPAVKSADLAGICSVVAPTLGMNIGSSACQSVGIMLQMLADEGFCTSTLQGLWGAPVEPVPSPPAITLPGGYCHQLAQAPCWEAHTGDACTRTAGCRWVGRCLVSNGSSPTMSPSPRPTESGPAPTSPPPVDPCENCTSCVRGATAFGQTLTGVEPSSYAKAAAEYCTSAGAPPTLCQAISLALSRQPELARRPAALCKAVQQCSTTCVAAGKLELCSADGSAAGIPAPAAPTPSTCSPTRPCSAGLKCDSFNHCNVNAACNATTGFDTMSCEGSCVDRCADQAAFLLELNSGKCDASGDCPTGLTCNAVASKTCTWYSCNPDTGITQRACAGFCTLGTPTRLVSAQLSSDGRLITLTFDTDVFLWSSRASEVFTPATAALLGGSSGVSPADQPNQLLVWLDPKATAAVGSAIAVRAEGPIVDRAQLVKTSGGSQALQAPTTPDKPIAAISGPATVGSGCGGAASAVTLDATMSHYLTGGRGVSSFQWAVISSSSAALTSLLSSAAGASVTLPGDLVSALQAGAHTLQLVTANWLGASSDPAVFTLTKAASAVPLVAVLGGASQSFSLATGVKVQSAINSASVCSGASVTYAWQETSGLLPAGSFLASRKDLIVPAAATASLSNGDQLTFVLTATLQGAGSATTSVTLTAVASSVIAAITGPRGDVFNTADLTWSARGSSDPDDPTNAHEPFRFSWGCTAVDQATQDASPCFAPGTVPTTNQELVIPAGTLPASTASKYRISLTVAKGTPATPSQRTDTDEAEVEVLDATAGIPPTGYITRFCPGSSCKKAHTATEPLRLVYTLDDPTLAAGTTYAWASSSADLTAAGATDSTTKQNLVLLPAALTDGATVEVSVTATRSGVSSTATFSVQTSRRPTCTATGGCLSVSPASPAQDAAVTLAASGWLADNPLAYDFGLMRNGRRVPWAYASPSPSYTLPPSTLPTGDITAYACTKDVTTGASACETAVITVSAPPQPLVVDAQAVTVVSSAIATALSSGAPSEVFAASRRLSALQATSASSAVDAAVKEELQRQASSALTALSSIVDPAAQPTLEDSLGTLGTLSTLTASTSAVSKGLAAQALSVALSAAQALSSSAAGGAVSAADLDPLPDVAAACSSAAVADAGARRRLLATTAEEARASLESATALLATAQQLAIVSKVAGESPTAFGTGALIAAVAVADSAVAESYPIGSTGAAVTLLPGFASFCSATPGCPSSIPLLLSHTSDPSLLLAAITESTATAPAPGGSRRRLLAAAPGITGADSTSLASGVVKFNAPSLEGLSSGTNPVVEVTVPLTSAYNPQQAAMCLRLVDNAWSSEGVVLTAIDTTQAVCALTVLTSTDIMVVNYQATLASLPPPAKPKPNVGAIVGGVVGAVGGLVVLAGVAFLVIRHRAASRPKRLSITAEQGLPLPVGESQPVTPSTATAFLTAEQRQPFKP